MSIVMKSAAAIILLPLVIGFAAAAFAEDNAASDESQVNETQARMNAKISIGDAIKTAEDGRCRHQ